MQIPNVKVGDWYLDRDKHDFLCVIGVDEDEGIIDIRDEHGDIDEIDFEEWDMMDLVLCSTLREWTLSAEQEAEEMDEAKPDSHWSSSY